MRKAISALLVILVTTLAATTGRSVEDTWDNSVRASSSVQASPAKITISWPQDERYAPSSYTIYRRLPGASSWGTGTVLSGSTTSYADTNVAAGTAYEYRIVKVTSAYPGYGYIQTGINIPLVENRGKVVLIVDNTYAANLATELTRLERDLTGDGWTVLRHDVSRTATVPSVKALIKADYTADPGNVKSVFLFGHVPVPYSGQLNPDGHPEHTGAWPADAYYGDMDGTWTDNTVNYSQTSNTNPAERTRLSNFPGDGKFDQTTLPSVVELQIGRVDLSNMPGLFYTGGPTTFPSELELLRQYLNKDHNFRHRVINPQRRAIVGDYFGWRNGETFSSSAYGAFAAFFGADKTLSTNVAYNDTKGVWVPELAKNDYLCAFGAGAGSYGSIAGLGNGATGNTALTTEIVNNNIRAVFTLLFGSWLGDWDSQDNFMRGILATKDYGLTAAWSGRPHWFIHPMGLGETIGYTARLTQNNKGDYQNQVDSSRNLIHIALMGDPTLHLHIVAPVSSLACAVNGSVAALTWNASPDTVLGYHVYRATSANGPFTRLNSALITSTSFTDSNSTAGATYMVRAVKLESTPSGSYENASQGVFWTTGGTTPPTTGDTSAPSVSLTSPSGGSTVSGSSVAISVSASDNVGIAGVQFKLDGANLGSEDTNSPYSVTWDTTSAANGSHTLTAVARDAAGNTKTSSAATVTVSNTTTTPPTTTAGWVDDALPTGAVGYGSEAWTWVTGSPAPVSGSKAHQSALASGLHEHAFAWASSPMAVATGDTLYAYVYIDPANVPTELMLHWNDGSSWDHRAYWGANSIGYGTDGTASRYRVGALPATGQWVRLEIPASAVGLAGKNVTGMAFSAYNGRVTWDNTGTSSQSTPPTTGDTTAPTVLLISPAIGATVSGSSVAVSATAVDNVGVTGVQFQLDGADLGSEDTSSPYSVTWDTSTATNGAHVLTAIARDAAGNTQTSTNVSVTVGNVVVDITAPTVSLSAPATGATVSGSSVAVSATAADNTGVAGVQFKLDGANFGSEDTTAPYSVTWNTTSVANGSHSLAAVARDAAGNTKTSTNVSVTVSNTTTTPPTTAGWVDDALPTGATGYGSEAWNWVTSPAPVSGSKAHQSALASGLHEHAFAWASSPMSVATGDTLYAYVYIDPANVPTEIMLHWNDGSSWDHRAYWGANSINYGTNGTASRYRVGNLPATGKWVRLEIPASAVNLAGKKVTGMAFSAYNGRVTWDDIGTSSQSTPPTTGDTTAPTVSLSAPAAGATVSGSSVAVSATAADNTGVAGVQFKLDGANLGSEDTSSPYSVTWNTTSAANGSHVLTAVARDAAGNTQTATNVSVTVSNTSTPPSDTTAPTVSLSAPAASATVSGSSVAVSATAADNIGVAGVQFKLDGANLGSEDTSSPYSATWNTTSAANGSHVLTAVARDAAGNTQTATNVSVTVSNVTTTPPDTTPPTPIDLVENAAIEMPKAGHTGLTILTPTMLELERINTKQPDPAVVDSWNFVSSTGVFTAPAASKFAVTVDGQSVAVQSIGFRRRVRYAPLDIRDLRIGNYLYVQLATPVTEGQTVVVKNADATLWPATVSYTAKADPLRNSPAIHVNQEGYVPSLPKKAMVGYYLGNLGELSVSAGSGFKLVNAATGATVYQGSLVTRADVGYNYSPMPYQKVLQADFSGFTTPGEYQLVVPGMGASLPFLINDGIAMGFVRTYALGLYHQRCGASNAMPFTRFTHDACHMAAAEIPSPQSNYQFTWTTIATKNADTTTTDPAGVGPQLKDEASQLYPFVNKGTVNVSGGHHDAGDYSKYTINVAQLTHLLMFTADSIAGAGALDNLGIPESGDGISDIMQEAKQEADYLAKLQDADGGFYFIVYPKTREYEGNVTPDHGDTQVVWPKNTSATAASVAALAQMASSPKFKAAYPAVAATYLTKARLGWQFLMNGIAKYGKNGAYQKVTFYGDDWIHNDEIAWAACELFLATGDAQYSQKLTEWFPNPADTATMRWGWWRMSQSWGNAIRSYAFAARSGRLAASQLNSTYLAACEGQIKAAGDDALARSTKNAYGTAFPLETKGVLGGGWYFSLDMAADMSVAYQINPNAAYLDALVTNMNYEAGSNPVNVTYLTGLGLKRQRETVNQYAKNDRRMLTPSGIPIGNIQASLPLLTNYSASGNELSKLSFPSDGGSTGTYSFYDRWSDTWNVSTEFITVNQARGLMAVAALAPQTSAKSTPWKSATASMVVPTTTVALNTPVTLSLVTTGLDLTNARIVWEGRDQEPDFGPTFAYTPKNTGAQWAEAEITWPDGRRVFAVGSFTANSPVVTWVEDALPAGATGYGSEAWTWVGSGPTPYSGTKAHQSVIAAGLHEHAFNDASSPLVLVAGDKLFAYVYLDPANVPTEIMLHWADSNGSWDHRAYWGANSISYGADGTASRYRVGNLPAAGGWVRLEVPAKTVGLEGSTVKGMCFSTFGGRSTWDATGKSSL